jgi:dGTPase
MSDVMQTDFYNDFDRETLEPRGKKDYRSVFQVDRDRILYSPAFRKLQSKTQVFLSGTYDFYRTRLTHSLEVAQIGRSIANVLNRNVLRENAIDSDLIEGICLTHDIGNPPFGHAGEAALNELMRHAGGFEGNAQTLKIVTEKIHDSDEGDEGMKPSRAFIDGIMKYKILWSESDQKGKFLYDDQKPYVEFLSPDGTLYRERSLECSIMNWADDVAYALHDLLDGYQAGFISRKNVYEWAVNHHIQGQEEQVIQRLLDPLEYKVRFEKYIAARTGDYIENVTLTPSDHPMKDISNRYKYTLKIPEEIIREIEVYKQVAVDLMFKSPQLEQIEFKGQYILKRIFSTFLQGNPDSFHLNRRILPEEVRSRLNKIPENDYAQSARIICDYLAEQTDQSLPRLYKRLFDPDYGSFSDLI